MRALVLVILLSGCGTYQKEGATKADSKAAQKECGEESGSFGLASTLMFKQCMKEKGYEFR